MEKYWFKVSKTPRADRELAVYELPGFTVPLASCEGQQRLVTDLFHSALVQLCNEAKRDAFILCKEIAEKEGNDRIAQKIQIESDGL